MSLSSYVDKCSSFDINMNNESKSITIGKVTVRAQQDTQMLSCSFKLDWFARRK